MLLKWNLFQKLIDLCIRMIKWKPVIVKHSRVKKAGFIDRWIHTKKSWVRKMRKVALSLLRSKKHLISLVCNNSKTVLINLKQFSSVYYDYYEPQIIVQSYFLVVSMLKIGSRV